MSAAQVHPPACNSIPERVASFGWSQIYESLRNYGWASTSTPASAKTALAGGADTGPVLTFEECCRLRALYANEAAFRSKVVMARHRFGVGEYKYFSYPLPQLIKELRESLYAHLAEVANEWSQQLHLDVRYPASHSEFISVQIIRFLPPASPVRSAFHPAGTWPTGTSRGTGDSRGRKRLWASAAKPCDAIAAGGSWALRGTDGAPGDSSRAARRIRQSGAAVSSGWRCRDPKRR